LIEIMNKASLRRLLIIIGIPTAYALLLRFIFGVQTWMALYEVMSITFLFFLPTIVGALLVYLSPLHQVEKFWYRFFMPWIPIVLFFIITLALAIEGWACWIMVLPLFLLAASVGGLIGGYLKRRKRDNKLYISVLALLPLFISPLEQSIGAIPGTYEAYTSIDIHAPADRIWQNVTRVKEIPGDEDKGWLTRHLGFPRPLRAELNYNGVGASREAVFTNGLVFHETVLEYAEQKKMVFSIKAYPYEIPSTTMDEHVVIGGRYFDVLNGTYELEPLGDGAYRLHLYSHFKLNTTFNFYASWWARWIMQDIQNNILQVEKRRAEQMP
jgi:hypothetical protein